MRSIQKRFKYALLAPVFIVATLVMQFSNVSLVAAATVTWDGEGVDNNFSTEENWSGDAVPQAFDDLVFPANAGTDTTLVNDLGVSFNDITVNGGAGSAGSYDIDTLDLIDGAVITVIGSDTQVNITDVDAAGDLTVNGGSKLDITTLDVTTDLTVSGVFDATTVNVGGNLSSSVAFVAPTVDVTGNAVFDTAAPTITTLSANNLTVEDDDLSVTTLTLTGDFLAASTNALTVTGTFTAPNNYTVSEGFTAGTFVAQGDLVVDVVPTITTLSVTGDLTSDVALSVTTLNLAGDFLTASTGTLTVTGTFTVPSDYTVTKSFTAGTFDVGGDLTVNNTFTATTTDITGDLATTSAFVPGDLTVGGNASITSAFTANSIDVTGDFGTTATTTVTTDMDVAGTIASGSTGAINVTGTLTVDSDVTLNFSSSLITAGTFHVTGDLTFSRSIGGTAITVDGNVQANTTTSSFVLFTVGGDMTIGVENSYTPTIRFADGTDITGDVTVEKYSQLYQDDAATISMNKLIVKNGGRANLNGDISFPVEFGSGKSKAMPAITYNTYGVWDAEIEDYVYPDLNFTGDTTLKNDLRVSIYGNKDTGSIEFSGDITYNGFKISKSSSSLGKLIIDGKEVKNPKVTNEYNGERFDQSELVAENETGVLNGSRSSVAVYPGGVLKGTGTALSVAVYFNGTLSPGNSPGTMTIPYQLQLQEDAIYYVELKNENSFDKVVVGVDYDSTGNAVDITDAVLDLALYEGYSIKKGDTFMIIDNKSDTDIEGTFKNLAEGDTISLGGGTFEISYVGGDGNDVVLTVTKAPTAIVGAPNTGLFRLIQANPAVSAIIGLMTAAILFLLARRQLAMQRR